MESRSTKEIVKVELRCDKCGGEILPTGTALMSNPPIYPHVCTTCGNTEQVNKIYPYTELK